MGLYKDVMDKSAEKLNELDSLTRRFAAAAVGAGGGLLIVAFPDNLIGIILSGVTGYSLSKIMTTAADKKYDNLSEQHKDGGINFGLMFGAMIATVLLLGGGSENDTLNTAELQGNIIEQSQQQLVPITHTLS